MSNQIIHNEAAYERGKRAAIIANARKGNLKRWLAESPDHQELYDWLIGSGQYANVKVAMDTPISKYGGELDNLPVGYKQDHVDSWGAFEIVAKDGINHIRSMVDERHPIREKMFAGKFGSFILKLAQTLTGNHHHAVEYDTGEKVECWGKLSEKQTDVVREALARAKVNLEQKGEREARWAAESAGRDYVGEVGEKHFEVAGTISFATSWEGTYGITHLTVIRDADDNSIKYKGKMLGHKGDTVSMIATIKAHEIYKGEKQTIVNRPRQILISEGEQYDSGS
jgi:hypothetical protein